MFDKPVINVGYNPPSVPEGELSYARYYRFDHYAPVVASGAVKVAGSVNEMRELIQAALEKPAEEAAQRKNLLRQMFGEGLDGGSGQRAAKVLIGLARQPLNPR